MSTNPGGIDLRQALSRTLHEHWLLFLIEGIVLVVLGMLAIAAGIVLLGWPISGAVSLTLLLIVFFVIEGVASIMYALEHKKELTGRWAWMLVSGIIDLILAVIILAGLPETAKWALGLLVGINMLFGGTSMIAIALHARGSAPGAPSASSAA